MKRPLKQSNRFTAIKLPAEVVYFIFFVLTVVVVLIIILSTRNFKIYAQDINLSTPSQLNNEVFKYTSSRPEVKNHPINGIPQIVEIIFKDSSTQYITYSSNIDAILSELNVDHQGYKTVPALDTTLKYPSTIKLIKLDSETTTETQAIEFQTEYIENPEIEIGIQSQIQEGKEGELTLTWENIYEDGELTEKNLISKETTIEPVNTIIEVGTKVSNKSIKSCTVWDQVIDTVAQDPTKNAWMKSVMRCESMCDAGISSRDGRYYGLFQFMPATFRNKGGTDIFDGQQQIEIVSKMYENGPDYRQRQWGGCNAKFVSMQ